MLYDAFVYRQPSSHAAEEGYMIEFDSRPSSAPSLIELLKRYVLRSKVKVKDVSEQWDVWAAWGTETVPDDRKWLWSRSGAVEPVWAPDACPWGDSQDTFSILDRRAHGMGKRILVRKGDTRRSCKPSEWQHTYTWSTTALEASSYNVRPSEAYTTHRISHGVPEGIIDMPPLHAFPIESNLDAMGASESLALSHVCPDRDST